MRPLLLVATAVVAVAGCGPNEIKKVTVTGTASYKGQKLPGGMLKFVGPGGSYTACVIQPDGTFTMTDVVPGEVKVAFMPAPQGSGGPDVPKASKAARPPVDLPAKFMDTETSGVSYAITDSTKTLDIEFK